MVKNYREGGMKHVAIVPNPEARYWRTDIKRGRGIYALISNDVTKPSEHDPLIATTETPTLAELIVDTHNNALQKFGRHYPRVLASDE